VGNGDIVEKKTEGILVRGYIYAHKGREQELSVLGIFVSTFSTTKRKKLNGCILLKGISTNNTHIEATFSNLR